MICPKCKTQCETLFSWGTVIVREQRPDDFICFNCANKRLSKILTENESLKRVIDCLNEELEDMVDNAANS